ncbi:MAG: GNAT family N-acetyltransferase [Alphaproteobacteria bacterium]
MLRIRKITDSRAPANASAVEEAMAIIRAQFPGMPPADVDKLPDQLDNPFRHAFIAELFVAEDSQGPVKAAAVLLHDPDLAFAYLEVISVAPDSRAGSGIGGALYDRIREEADELGATGLYFECLPDDPETSPAPAIRRQSASRLRFYERYGAFPIVGTDYQAPLKPGDADMPFLVFDGLGRHSLPDAARLRRIVREILERKYGHLCPPGYIDRVVRSIRDSRFRLRSARYVKPEQVLPAEPVHDGQIPLVVNAEHLIHHVRERGYVEAPVRVGVILAELDKTGLFRQVQPKGFPQRHIRAVHDAGLVDYIARVCAETPANKSVYPYVFPIRNAERRPKERSVLAGYWCIDTFTPLNRNVWPAARRAVDCALTAAEAVLQGAPLAYALVRPPGHHAERRSFGGFCYFCNGAIAANYLAPYGRVAMLDIDYHHGNGQQDIFYERDDVLTVSIHGHPSFAYPYFTGFRNESGRGRGAGFNLNLPLPETITPEQYLEALATALDRIARFEPAFLLVSLGLDTGRGDPTGTWPNRAADFGRIGAMIGEAGYPTVVVQEGGYRVRTLGNNARHFFTGLAAGAQTARARARRTKPARGRGPTRPRGLTWREAVGPEDASRIRTLVMATGMFSAEEVDIAQELVRERVVRGKASGYEFVIVERDGQLAGYACHGPIPGSEVSHDLYWIAVHPDHQGSGLGRAIQQRAEAAIRRAGGMRVYADTSSSPAYAPTRAFYARMGFSVAAELPDFYRVGDGKTIMVKVLEAPPQ